jgi:hypothetical protein
VADVKPAYTDEVVGEPGGKLVAGDVVDLERPEIEDVRHRDARQAVEFLGVLDQILAQPEFVVAFDPGDAGLGQRTPERAQYGFAGFNLAPEVFSAPGRKIVTRDLPEILEVAVQDQPVGAFPPKEQLEQPKRLLVVEGYLKIVGDDGELVSGTFSMIHRLSGWGVLAEA